MRKTQFKRVRRINGIPYLRYCIHENKYRWCIRIDGKEYGYPKYIALMAGIDLVGKRILYREGYNIKKTPTIEDIVVMSNSEYFKLVYLHNYPNELKEAYHHIIELTKKINHEIRNNT